MSNPDPIQQVLESLTADVASAIEPALRRAFAEGYKKGVQEAQEQISAMLSGKAAERLPAILGANSVPQSYATSTERRSPPVRGMPTNKRRYAYGSVIGAFRKALLAHAENGITREGMREYCRSRFDMPITPNSAREVLKRLSADNEAVYRDNLWFPGDELKAPSDEEEPKENEPRNGQSVGGSDTGSLFGAGTPR